MRAVAALIAAVSLGLAGSPAWAAGNASDDTPRLAVQAAVDACVDWITEPKSWIDHPDDFPKNIGFDKILDPQAALPNGMLPEEMTGKQPKVWLIHIGAGGGVYVAADLHGPLCNAAGGGSADFQPAAMALTSDPEFVKLWEKVDTKTEADMVSERWQFRSHPALAMIVSHAMQPGARTDRVQFLATVQLDLKDQ